MAGLALSCGGGGGGGSSSSGGTTPAPTPVPTPTPTPTVSANKGTLLILNTPDNSAYALFVGIGDYLGAADLSYTAKDAIDLCNSFNGGAFWNNAVLSVRYNDANISKTMIQTAVTDIKNSIANNGLFIFFYSGHGTHSGNIGYIVPYDAAEDTSKMISEDDLKIWIDEFDNSVNKYVLLDSCYSGDFIDARSLFLKPRDLKPKYIPIKGSDAPYLSEKFAKSLVGAANCYAMMASKGSELSFESTALQNGVFTYYMKQGLGTGATIGPASTDSGNTITAEDLTTYVPPLVTEYILRQGQYQTPQTYDNVAGTLRVK